MNRRRLATLCVLAAAHNALASGLRIAHQDAAATARGDAFVATADNASAVFYNPAGITQMEGVNARVGNYAVILKAKNKPPGGGSYENEDRVINVPNAYLTWSPANSRFSLGLGVNAPFGLALAYKDDVPSRDANKKAKLIVASVTPVLAYQICDTLSIGIGPNVNYGEAQDQRGLGRQGDGFKFRGSGEAYGFIAGILWKPTPKHAFGVTYHSHLDFEFSGHTQITVKPFANETKLRFPEEDAALGARLPQFIVAGYSFRPAPDWNLEVNVDWTDWDNLNSAPLKQQTSPDGGINFNWRSGFIYEFGVTHTFGDGFHASAGYAYSEANNPESTFTPGVPDNDRHILSAGIGKVGDHFSWDVGYQYSLSGYRRIDNDGPADGHWRVQSHALMVSVGYRF